LVLEIFVAKAEVVIPAFEMVDWVPFESTGAVVVAFTEEKGENDQSATAVAVAVPVKPLAFETA
jgi:hypothetical protein